VTMMMMVVVATAMTIQNVLVMPDCLLAKGSGEQTCAPCRPGQVVR
jgi:hypothetical protein